MRAVKHMYKSGITLYNIPATFTQQSVRNLAERVKWVEGEKMNNQVM